MSKVVLTADVHLDYKDRLPDTIKAMNTISSYMEENDIEYAMVMGDLFNDRTAVATDAMNAAYNFFKKAKNIGQVWGAFPGNHDIFMKYSWEVNSLKSLSEVLNVYERECLIELLGQRFWILPYIHDEEVYMKAISAIAEQSRPTDVLLTHIGVNDSKLNECFLNKHWSYVTFKDFPLRVYTGHFHCHQQVGHNVWYPGSPIPFRFDEGLVDHGFIVYDIEQRSHEFVKIFDLYEPAEKPPDFITIIDSSVESLTADEVVGNNVKISLGREYTNDERVQLREKLIGMGAISISWAKAIEADVNIDETVTSGETISLADPSKLLSVWLEQDKPDWINVDLLMSLNAEITDRSA